MTADEIRKKLEPWLQKHTRSAWLPVLEDGLKDPRGSHFGGGAWVLDGAEPPVCEQCGERLRLLLQLDLAALPERAHQALPRSGLLQVFYCEDGDCEQEAEGYLAFSGAHRVLIVPAGPGRVEESAEPYPPKTIVSWEQAADHPHPEDIESLGLKTEYDFKKGLVRYLCPEVGLDEWVPLDVLEIEALTQARDGDKLRGWPYWIQSAEYPQCPKCKAGEMTHLFQIESEKGVPYMWGDAGIAQVTYCERHPEVMTLNWSCG